MGFLTDLLSGGRGTIRRRAATPENPRFDLNSSEAWDALGGERSATGEPVSADSALTWSAWYRGVSMLARDAAKTPTNVFRTNGKGRKEVDKKHPAYQLLRWRANEAMTAFQFKQCIYGHAINRGNGYAHIRRTAGGDPVELLFLDPDSTEPDFDPSGRLWYVTTLASGEKRKLHPEDVLHIRGFGFDGVQGYPAVQMAKDTIALGQAQQKFKAIRFRNSARPAVVLEAKGPVKPASRQALRTEWENMHTGLENSHRTAILDNGLTAKTLSFTAEEMQEVENAGLSIRDAANFLGIPSSKLGDTAGIKYASKEQDDQAYLDDGLDYWFHGFEDEAREKLLSVRQKESESHSVVFDRGSLIRTDLAAKTQYWRTALGGAPWAVQNEARHDFDMEPLDDPAADELHNPLNMGQGGADNEDSDPNPEPKREKGAAAAPVVSPTAPAVDAKAVRAAAETALTDATRRMVRRVGLSAQRAAKKPAGFMAWVDSIREDDGPAIRDALLPAEAIAATVGGVKAGQMAEWLIAELSLEYSTAAGEATAKELEAKVAAVSAEHVQRIPQTLLDITFAGVPAHGS